MIYAKTRSVLGILILFAVLTLPSCSETSAPPANELSEDSQQAVAAPNGRWVLGLADTRIPQTGAHFGSDDKAPGNRYRNAMGSEIWCVPGCQLTNAEDGQPIVPEWCTAWGEMSEQNFVRENADDHLSGDNSVIRYTSPLVEQHGKQYACTRIDLGQVTRNASAAVHEPLRAFDFPSKFLETDENEVIYFDNRALGLYCLPGCVLSRKRYDDRSNDGDILLRDKRRLPEWCVDGSGGCRVEDEVGQKCSAHEVEPSICHQVKFSDVDYGVGYVE